MKTVRKRTAAAAAALLLAAFLTACAGSTETPAPAAAADEAKQWDTAVPAELTEDVLEFFNAAAEKTGGAEYLPLAVLGELDGTYCILCKEADAAAPKNVLVYVNRDGIQNTYEIWIEKHAEKGK